MTLYYHEIILIAILVRMIGLTCGDVLFSSYAMARWEDVPHYIPKPCVKIGNQARCVIQCEADFDSSMPDNQQEYVCDRTLGWEKVRGTEEPYCDGKPARSLSSIVWLLWINACYNLKMVRILQVLHTLQVQPFS